MTRLTPDQVSTIWRRIAWRLPWLTMPRCEFCGGRIFRLGSDGPWNHHSPKPFDRFAPSHPVWFGPR